MNLRALLHRFEAHQSLSYLLIRVFLGFALFIRGALFIADQEPLMTLIVQKGLDWFFPTLMVHYITLAHLMGGLMLIFGLLTRTAALVQVPILFGAVFFVHLSEGLFATGQSLELAVLVLFLLLVVFAFGSGDISLDYYIWGKRKGKEEKETPSELLPPSGIIAPETDYVHRSEDIPDLT